MNKKGFTLVELLATIVILSIIVGITIVTTNGSLSKAKRKTEDIFIKTIEDALTIYLDSDAKNLTFDFAYNSSNNTICTIHKRFGEVKLYKNAIPITFNNIINSEYSPLVDSDIVNPANEDVPCDTSALVSIYRDDDYVYYYYSDKQNFGCITTTGYITNLPSGIPSGCIG